MVHEGQGGRAFPAFPRGQDIHRCFTKDQAWSRRELIEQEDKGLANSGRFIGLTIMESEGIAFIFDLSPIVLERLNEVGSQSLHPSLTDSFSPDQRRGSCEWAFQTMVPDQVGNHPIDSRRQIVECAPGDDGAGDTMRQLRQPLINGLGECDGIPILRNPRQCSVEVKGIENGTARQRAKRTAAFVRKQVGHVWPLVAVRASRTPVWRTMRARCRMRAASISMRPAQRYTLNSCTMPRMLRIRARCSVGGIVRARCKAAAH